LGEGASVRNFRGIVSMGATFKIGIIDYSVNGECGGDGGNKGNVRKRRLRRRKE
jgi:hypothetical protein